MKPTKKKIRVEVSTVQFEYETLGSALVLIQDLINQYGEDAMIVEEEYTYSKYKYLAVMIEREETDVEYAARLKIEAGYKESKDLADEREYARLKAKFNNT